MDIRSLKINKEKEWFESKYKPELEIKGKLSEEIVYKISKIKNEPEWMLKIRLKGLEAFKKQDFPDWGPKLDIDFDKITYYALPIIYPKPAKWEELPEFIREVYRKLGITKEYLEKYLGGAILQFDSSPVYEKIKDYLESLGVIFTSLDTAVKEYPELVKKYFGKIISPYENKFAALNTAVWSGGVFIYVPKGVKVDIPLHAYFRINLENMGQFERTLIIVEEGAKVSYVEGCSAPIYSLGSLHAAVVETYVHKDGELNYYTIQNWSKNVYNLVTKRAYGEENSIIRWVSLELGSKVTMLYPSLILNDNSIGEIYTISYATDDQILDTGGRLFIKGKNVRAIITSKGLSIGKKREAKTVNRTDVKIFKGAENSYVKSSCESLLIGKGISESIPRFEVYENSAYYNHEAKMEAIDKEKIFYLKSKGISEKDALKLIIFGFLEDITEKLPNIYRLEIKKLLDIELEKYGGIG